MKHLTSLFLLAAITWTASNGAWGQCSNGEIEVEFTLTSGLYPSEISWFFNDSEGNNLFSGGAPADWTFCLTEGTYVFIGNDSFGDGWNGAVANFVIDGVPLSPLTLTVEDGYFMERTISVNDWIAGCTNLFACNYDSSANLDDDSCEWLTCAGCTDTAACNYDAEATVENFSCEFTCLGCTNATACNFDSEASIDDGSCSFFDAIGVCAGTCSLDNDNNGVCDDQEIYGCSYPLAENFSSSVTRDDGSCIFPCEGAVNINVFDWDEDYAVTIADFLAMLSVFGDVDVDSDGVWDSSDLCVDINACNYANDPSEPCGYIDVLGICGGGCEADEDNDGICDDIDSCIGVEDECGVCNGPGPTEVVIEDITILYDSVYLPQLEEWYVYEFGADTTFSYECLPVFPCGEPVSYQGHDYATVLIGEQCWFAENLRSENYENGDPIPSGLSDSEWESTDSGARSVFGEGDSDCNIYVDPTSPWCDEVWAGPTFGFLYNWFAVLDERKICPSDWHAATHTDWLELAEIVGGVGIASTFLKSNDIWPDGGEGNDSSGFSALPGGRRDRWGFFTSAGGVGDWWTSTIHNDYEAKAIQLEGFAPDMQSFNAHVKDGRAIRCIRDAE